MEDLIIVELADRILAISRLLQPSSEEMPSMCTPLESRVMRFIDRNPGASAREASEATQLPTSNFARVLRSLEAKGMVRREIDTTDARRARLHPTDLARKNVHILRTLWTKKLTQVLADRDEIERLVTILGQLETELMKKQLHTPSD